MRKHGLERGGEGKNVTNRIVTYLDNHCKTSLIIVHVRKNAMLMTQK